MQAFLLPWRPLWLGMRPGVPVEQHALLPTGFGPFILMVMVGGKQVANTSFLGKWRQVQLAKFSESTFWYPRNRADIRWLSHWERYRTQRCHSCFIYRNLVIQVHKPKAIMSFSEAEPGWWKVLPHFIPLFLSSPELKIAGDTVSPLFSLPFLFWLQSDLWF